MANSLSTNPLVFDVAGATSAVTRPVAIKAIHWDNPGAANAVVTLDDAVGGNLVFEHHAKAQYDGGDTVHFDRPLIVPGLYLTTLDSGKLLVYEE
jgi:hypothetical protein